MSDLFLEVEQPVETDEHGIPRLRKCVICGQWHQRTSVYPPKKESVLGVCEGCALEIIEDWWSENVERKLEEI